MNRTPKGQARWERRMRLKLWFCRCFHVDGLAMERMKAGASWFCLTCWCTRNLDANGKVSGGWAHGHEST